jgi:hypothetical protein
MWVGWHVYKWTVVSVSHQNQDNICDWGDMSTSGHTVKIQLRWYHTLQVEFDLLVLFFLFFLAVCLNISTVINIKILTNSNQQTRSYKFTSHIAAFPSGFDHRDAWNLHTHIIWSKRSTDFKELSPCSVWYPLNVHDVFMG